MKKIVIPFLSLILTAQAFSQKISLVQGSIKVVRGQKSMAIEFTYDSMMIGKKNPKPELEYLKEQQDEKNAKEPGKGDTWVQAWNDDRKNQFEPLFKKTFFKWSRISTTGDNPPFTMIVHTSRTEPGWQVTNMIKQNALIDVDLLIVKTSDKSKVVAKIKVVGAPGASYDTGTRILEAYATAAREIALFIVPPPPREE